MTMMLTPDLLDRRALVLLQLVDGRGQPVEGPVAVTGPGVRSVAKRGGQIALIEATGLATYGASFATPVAPAVASLTLAVDLTPAAGDVLPRRLTLRLPRDPDPANRALLASLFQPVVVPFAASPRTKANGNDCILRVAVKRTTDQAMVENALVRARSADGTHSAWGLTDASGEAALVFGALPITFAGGGGATLPTIDCAVVVHADPASARFATPQTLAAARRDAATRSTGHPNPDAIATAQPTDFAGAAMVAIGAGRQPTISLGWTPP